MRVRWGWAVLTFTLTGALLLVLWVLALWSTVGTRIDLIDLAFWGLSLILMIAVVVNSVWPPTLALNVAVILFLAVTNQDGWLAQIGRGIVLLLVMNSLLLATFYARRRAIH
ncbi:MAG: hypothetical protein ACR2QF_15185 [Geminicoccaceae bacterium]